MAVPYTLRLKSGDFTTVRGQNDNRLRHYRFPRGWDPRCLRRDNDDLNQLRERAAEMRASSSTTGSLIVLRHVPTLPARSTSHHPHRPLSC